MNGLSDSEKQFLDGCKNVSVNQLVYEAGKFGDHLNKNRTPRNALIKLALEEVPELLCDMSDPMELADILILAFDIAYIKGWDMQKAFDEKMKINWGRKWSQNSETGIYNHIPCAVPKKCEVQNADDPVNKNTGSATVNGLVRRPRDGQFLDSTEIDD